jgi:hypothetical protein
VAASIFTILGCGLTPWLGTALAPGTLVHLLKHSEYFEVFGSRLERRMLQAYYRLLVIEFSCSRGLRRNATTACVKKMTAHLDVRWTQGHHWSGQAQCRNV